MDELPKHVRALLDAARSADDPTNAEREQVDRTVRAAFAAYGVHVPPLAPRPKAANTNPAPSPAPAQLGGALGAKAFVAALIVCAGGWLALRALDRTPRSEARAAGVTLPAPPVAPVTTRTAPGVPPIASVSNAPEAVALATHAPTSKPHAQRATTRAQRRSGALDAELELIAEADSLVRDARFDAALHALARHAQRFPNGALREERVALRVLSRCGKDPNRTSAAEGARFLRSNPRSVLAGRVSAACASAGADVW